MNQTEVLLIWVMACQLPSLLSSATLDLLPSGQGCPLPFVVSWQYGSTSIIQGISFYTKYFGGLLEQGIHGIQQLERVFRVIGVAWVLSACSAVSNQKSRLNVCLPAYLLTCLWEPFWAFLFHASVYELTLHHFCIVFQRISLCAHSSRDFIESLLCPFVVAKHCPSLLLISCDFLRHTGNSKKTWWGWLIGTYHGRYIWATFDNCLDGFHHNSWD